VTPLKEALTALADALAKPGEVILFDWLRSGRLVGELSVLIKRRHPRCKPRSIASTRSIWRNSANGVPTRGTAICPVADDDIDRGSGVAAAPHCGEISRAARLPPQCPSNVSTGKRGLSWTITGANWPGLAS